jgi:nucleotide-binding universal stress UspA family protein
VDGSPEATDAAVLGRRLAEAAGGSLRLVAGAAQAIVAVAATRAGIDADRLGEALLQAATEKATAGLRDAFATTELDNLLTARLGQPEQVLRDVARELGADLLVLGGHRKRGLPWLRRGTAGRLLRVCDAPVIVTGPAGPLVEHVVAAVDRSFAAAPTVEAARAVAGLLGAPLDVVHVVAEPLLPPSLGLDLDPEEFVRREEEDARAELEPLLPADTALTVRRGEVLASLQEMVERTPAMLLAVGAQGRGWVHRLVMGSTTETLLAELPASLIVIPASPPSSTHEA